MKISLDWLRQYTSADATVSEIVRALVETGTEVDRVRKGPEGVVVARVTHVEPVPKSSKGVQFADLDAGESDTTRVLTGAPNIKVGDLVPWAKPGARLPAFDAPIEAKKVMGFMSPGMLCSAFELGLGDDHDGIMILDQGSPGALLHEVVDFDTVFEVEVTPNRPDAMCHLGLARELSAGLGETVTPPATRIPDSLMSAMKTESKLSVQIETEGCRRFCARVIENVAIGPSPEWMQRRLRAIGLRPINNVVDITNYVMWESGQPLHAFDFDKFVAIGTGEKAEIKVRGARDGEKLLLLDGSERTLAEGDMVVGSGDIAVSLGAIMGGATTAVENDTKNVLLECAAWDGTQVRATSRRLSLRSDASGLFEKGLSDTMPARTLERAAALIAELAHGHVLDGVVDEWPHPLPELAPIEVETSSLAAILGYDVEPNEAGGALAHLGFAVKEDGTRLTVTSPAWRRDVKLVEDVAEEVGRILGYDRIPSTLPGSRREVKTLAADVSVEDQARDILYGAGFDEAITWSFIPRDAARAVPGLGGKRVPIEIQNPLSEEWAVMRTSLLPGLTEAVKTNLNLSAEGLMLFEIGRAFWEGERTHQAPGSTPDGLDAKLKPLPAEPLLLAMAICTEDAEQSAVALRQLQATLNALAETIGGQTLAIKPGEVESLHTRRSAELHFDGKQIGLIGELSAETTKALALRGRVVVAEIRLDALASQVRTMRYRQPPRFPAIVQDLSVLVPTETTVGSALAAISEAGVNILEHAELYDEFHGKGAGTDDENKSWTFRLTFRSADRTLTGEEANAAQEAVLVALRVRCNATVRK